MKIWQLMYMQNTIKLTIKRSIKSVMWKLNNVIIYSGHIIYRNCEHNDKIHSMGSASIRFSNSVRCMKQAYII